MKKVLLTAALVMGAVGCGSGKIDSNPNVDLNGPFVGVPRQDNVAQAQGLASKYRSSSAGATGVFTGESYYLAINKNELGQRWFLSSYLKEYYPGAVGGGAARSLGTRVVSFAVQGNKLYVFDASDNHTTSNLFDPQILIDAYPIVTDYAAFFQLPNANNYILIDPSAGLNRFTAVGDAFSQGGAKFNVDLSFIQRMRKLTDGVSFEQVFTGSSDVQLSNGSVGEANYFQASGTLSVALRRYTEGDGYTATQMPNEEIFFRSDTKIVPNTGTTTQTAVKWNIHPGMKPIKWYIDPGVLEAAKDPRFQGIDIVGALKRGVENWNQVFGFQALEAEVAPPDVSFADDDVNYVLFDTDPSYGAAFANWRTNPNTGEIRGATVYFSEMWLEVADQLFPDPNATNKSAQRPAVSNVRANLPQLKWEGMGEQPLCVLWAPNVRGSDMLDTGVASLDQDGNVVVTDGGATADGGSTDPDGGAIPGPTTRKEKIEAYLTHVLVHEIGHTLGLRHNFMGSIEMPSTSVMEYILDDEAIYRDTPGPYDYQAIQYLYGMSDQLPTKAFCTDEDTVVDPDCNRFDTGAHPLDDYYAPTYTQLLTGLLQGTSYAVPNHTANQVAKFIRAGTPDERIRAYHYLFDEVAAPIDAKVVAQYPLYGIYADYIERMLFNRLYMDDPSLRDDFTNDPPNDPAYLKLFVPELERNLLNVDGYRTFATRRLTVDILKKLQTTSALNALSDAQTQLGAQLQAMKQDDPAYNNTRDLLTRINNALSTYWVH